MNRRQWTLRLDSGAAIGAVVAVGIAHVERQVCSSTWGSFAPGRSVVTLRRLTVAFLELGTECHRTILRDLIGRNDVVAAIALLLPDFENGPSSLNIRIMSATACSCRSPSSVDELGGSGCSTLLDRVERILSSGQAQKQNREESQCSHWVMVSLELRIAGSRRVDDGPSNASQPDISLQHLLRTRFMKH